MDSRTEQRDKRMEEQSIAAAQVADPAFFRQALATAPVEFFRQPINGGGGHGSGTFCVELQGGIAALVKVAGSPEDLRQAKNEVAASLLAEGLGWFDLVPCTVFRHAIANPQGELVSGCLQPLIHGNTEWLMPISRFPDDVVQRAGVFDWLIGQNDRSANNWYGVFGYEDQVHLRFFDHGHSFGYPPGSATNSAWTQEIRGRDLDPAVRVAVAQWLAVDGPDSLLDLIGADEVSALTDRARQLISEAKIP